MVSAKRPPGAAEGNSISMSSFQLTKGAGIYEFDLAGGVSSGGSTVGSWTTNATNQIVTGSLAFDVAWLFNEKNQLTIQADNAEIFNFAAAGLYNSFATRDTALIVKPDRTAAFSFALNGDWTLSQDHNLTFTMGGIASTLDGFISDPIGRFIFHFANRDNVLETNVLGFAGSCSGDPMGSSTTLSFGAALTEPNLHGDLQLTVTAPNGTLGDSTFTIS